MEIIDTSWNNCQQCVIQILSYIKRIQILGKNRCILFLKNESIVSWFQDIKVFISYS